MKLHRKDTPNLASNPWGYERTVCGGVRVGFPLPLIYPHLERGSRARGVEPQTVFASAITTGNDPEIVPTLIGGKFGAHYVLGAW